MGVVKRMSEFFLDPPCDLLQDQVCLTAGKTQRNNSIVFSLSSIIEHY